MIALNLNDKVNSLLADYGVEASVKEIRSLCKEVDFIPEKIAAVYLNYQIQATTAGIGGYKQGLMLTGDSRKILSRAKGMKIFLHQLKTFQLWCIKYINLGEAVDFNQAVLRCNRLAVFFFADVSFAFDPILSERFDHGRYKIIRCRKLIDGEQCFLIQKDDQECVIFGDQSLWSTIKKAEQIFEKIRPLFA
ncbi:MAG: hypothetical protein KAQ63_03295 [Candidatus Moranbacteria bacterium]|nr:hypothetical protein [Candidatus Moranbacteria bacterium]